MAEVSLFMFDGWELGVGMFRFLLGGFLSSYLRSFPSAN